MIKYSVVIQWQGQKDTNGDDLPDRSKNITVEGAQSSEDAEAAALKYLRSKAEGHTSVDTRAIPYNSPNAPSHINLTEPVCPTCGRRKEVSHDSA